MEGRIADPLVGKPPSRIQLRSAPLVRVLGQVRFGKIISINQENFIAPFQEHIRGIYPHFQKDTAKAFQVQIGDAGVKTDTQDEVIWRFFDAPRVWRISLGTSAISLETLAYTSRDEFLDRFEVILSALSETISPGIATRVGFRYVNRLDKLTDLQEVNKLVQPELVGILSDDLRDRVEQSVSHAEFKTAEGRLLVRWGMLPAGMSHDPDMAPPVKSQSWMLDIDSFTTDKPQLEGFLPASLKIATDSMADRAYTFFRWAVTPQFLKRFGAEK